MSTVPLQVGRAVVLCPQYLSQWEGTGVLCGQTQAPGPRRCRIRQCSILPGPPHSLPLPVSCLALPVSTYGTFSERPACPLPL